MKIIKVMNYFRIQLWNILGYNYEIFYDTLMKYFMIQLWNILWYNYEKDLVIQL